ncbi:MAG: MFS transporter [Candidatus Nanohaloarchaea archaeon]
MYFSDWMQRVDLTQEIQEVYIHSFIFKLAESLVAIFIPFYIIQNGFGPIDVFAFYAIYYLTHMAGTVPFGVLATKIGYKHTSLLSSVFILAFYITIRSAETHPLLYLSAFLGGLGLTIYWMGMNPEVAKSSNDGKTEEETGLFFSMPSIASIIAPFTGGLILLHFGSGILFLIAAFLMFLSFTPFLLTSEHKDGIEMELKDIMTRDLLKDVLTYFAEGSHTVGRKILWPLYLAMVIGGSVNIGTAGTLLALGSAFTSVFVGKITSEKNKARVIMIGALISAATMIMMSQVTATMSAFAISALHGLSYTAVRLPIYSTTIKRAEQKDLMEYFSIREISLSMGRLTTLAVTVLLFKAYPQDFYSLGFAVVALGTLVAGYFGGRINS